MCHLKADQMDQLAHPPFYIAMHVPISFKLHMADLLFIVKDVDIASYADDNTPFIIEDNIKNIIASLEEATNALFDWFDNNRLKVNPDKCHALVCTNKHLNMKVCDFTIGNSVCEKLLCKNRCKFKLR